MSDILFWPYHSFCHVCLALTLLSMCMFGLTIPFDVYVWPYRSFCHVCLALPLLLLRIKGQERSNLGNKINSVDRSIDR